MKLSEAPVSYTANKLLDLVGRGSTHIQTAVEIARATTREGLIAPALHWQVVVQMENMIAIVSGICTHGCHRVCLIFNWSAMRSPSTSRLLPKAFWLLFLAISMVVFQIASGKQNCNGGFG